ncbi:calvin cycle protein CP12-2 [Hibiscus syriacus]|uniref:Calvin cycle protein CP12-2 n=1 Tax=Hibiscus syriacus TaxID=106335 RepID=A0A6A3C3U0_HIBSY|nr:calvin cycle protein CP12-2 [Hibiscus syriacus]
MASDNEPAKLLLPYLQRADELQKHEPLVAYYCRQQDRAGRADLNTAKTFYAASIFFDIINQFGPLQPDLEQKQKYAVWKAADIRKAIKEGRKPVPGPPNGDEDLSIPPSTPHGAHDFGPHDPAATIPHQSSDPSPRFHEANNLHSGDIRPSPHFHEANNQHSGNIPPSPQFHDKIDSQHSNISSVPPSFPSTDYPSHDQSFPQEPQQDFHPSFPGNRSENPTYPQPNNYQTYQQDQPPHFPVGYQSHEAPSFSYLIFSHIQVHLKVAYLQSRLTILLSIKAPRLHTVPRPLLRQQAIRQRPKTLQVAEMGKIRIFTNYYSKIPI